MKPEIQHIDQKTFIDAYNMHWKSLYALCKYYTGDKDIAKGLVQEIFINLWERREKLVIHTSLQSYLHQSVKLKVFEHYRSKKVALKYLDKQKEETTYTRLSFTDEHIHYKELNLALQLAVENLPDRCKEVYKLSRERGLSNRTIAEILFISEKAVEGNMTRALASIRKKLKIFKK